MDAQSIAVVITVGDDGVARAIINNPARVRIADTDQLVGLMGRVVRLLEGNNPFRAGSVHHACEQWPLAEAVARVVEEGTL